MGRWTFDSFILLAIREILYLDLATVLKRFFSIVLMSIQALFQPG